MKRILQGLNFAETETLVLGFGEKKFRAKQLFDGLTQGRKISAITSLSAEFRDRLLQDYEDEPVKIREIFHSSDGTEKYFLNFRTATSSKGC